MGKKYLLLCNRHNSTFGDNWCLWWGDRESKSGYTSDIRIAHRFDEEDMVMYMGSNDDIPVPIDILGIQEEYEPKETYNENLRVLLEKGTLNKLMNLNLRPLFQEPKTLCPNCGCDDIKDDYEIDELVHICKNCSCEFDEDGNIL